MTTDPSNHLFWITSRAAGTTALVLASASVCFGLMMGGRLGRKPAADRRIFHEALALATMVAIAIHALALLGDAYLRPSVADITVPFVSGYHRGWTSAGIIAGWGMIALGLGYYARRRIGPKRFRALHRLTLLFWAIGIVHSLGEGTDAGQPWFLAVVLLATVPATLLFGWRMWGVLGSRARRAVPPHRRGSPLRGARPAASVTDTP